MSTASSRSDRNRERHTPNGRKAMLMTKTVSTRTTVSDVARTAGVSLPTVSKVLNGRPGVSPATRKRVTGILQEHGFEPRRPPGRSAGSIELVMGELESPWSVSIVRAMEEATSAASLGLVLSCVRPAAPDHWLDQIASRDSKGVVFGVVETTREQRARLRELGVPFVVIDPEGNQPLASPAVGIAHWRGAYNATQHLIDLGHERIATIGGPLSVMCSRARTDGFRAAMTAAGLGAHPELVVHTNFENEAGRDAAIQLLALPSPPTAIFAASDEQALGVYEAARRAGLRIPDDVSVVGFNDARIAAWASPPLTTVREPIDEMVQHAVTLLGRLISGEPTGPAVELATELIVRESTSAPPATKAQRKS
jgi:LacI family transcriptional regulator